MAGNITGLFRGRTQPPAEAAGLPKPEQAGEKAKREVQQTIGEMQGTKVTDAKTERQKQREELLRQLQDMANKTTPAASAIFSRESRLYAIKDKLRNGRKLSAAEMRYLKENYPDVYEKAQKAEKARAELREQLKRARSKDEARMAILQAQIKALQEAKSGGDVTMASADDSSSGQTGTTGVTVKEAMAESQAAAEAAGRLGTEAAGESVAGTRAADGSTGETHEAAGDRNSGSNTDVKGDTETPGKTNEHKQEKLVNAYASVSAGVGRPAVRGAADTPLDTKLFYTLRALEDEGVEFLRSKHAKKLPERNTDIMQSTAK